jgi:hypothetical protein
MPVTSSSKRHQSDLASSSTFIQQSATIPLLEAAPPKEKISRSAAYAVLTTSGAAIIFKSIFEIT